MVAVRAQTQTRRDHSQCQKPTNRIPETQRAKVTHARNSVTAKDIRTFCGCGRCTWFGPSAPFAIPIQRQFMPKVINWNSWLLSRLRLACHSAFTVQLMWNFTNSLRENYEKFKGYVVANKFDKRKLLFFSKLAINILKLGWNRIIINVTNIFIGKALWNFIYFLMTYFFSFLKWFNESKI